MEKVQKFNVGLIINDRDVHAESQQKIDEGLRNMNVDTETSSDVHWCVMRAEIRCMWQRMKPALAIWLVQL